MPSFWVCLLAVGLTARLTRLATADRITAPLRAAVIRARGPESEWAYLVSCPWCVGLWLSIPVAVAAAVSGGAVWFVVPALTGTLSYATGLLARLEA